MQENPLQRETEVIKDREAINDLNATRKIMLMSRQKDFEGIQKQINQLTVQIFVQNPDKVYYPQSLQDELNYLQIFYKAIMANEPPQLRKNYYISDNYKLRILVLSINMTIKRGEIVSDNMLLELFKLVKDPNLKEEIMMKMVGCKSINRMVNITKQEIEDLTSDMNKRAFKYQVAADWKFLIGNQKEAISLKELSVETWKQIGKTNRSIQAKQQLDFLTKLIQGKKMNNPYVNKLKTLRKIVVELQNIPELSTKQMMLNKRKKITIKTMLPQVLENMVLPTDLKQKDDKNISNSVLKKQGIIEQRRGIGKLFLKEISANNFAYCSFIPQNKFESANIRELERKFGVLVRLYKQICRQLMDHIIKKIQQDQADINK